MGEIPFTECYPELWVVDDTSYGEALKILSPYYNQSLPEPGDWKCPKCSQEIESPFGECWSCGTIRPQETPNNG